MSSLPRFTLRNRPEQIGVGILLITPDFSSAWFNRRLACQHYNGYWQVPGGSGESNEYPSEAAARELLEETGIQVSPNRLTKVWNGLFTLDRRATTYRSFQFALLTDTTPQDLETDKHSAWELMPWQVIRRLQTFDAIRVILGHLTQDTRDLPRILQRHMAELHEKRLIVGARHTPYRHGEVVGLDHDDQLLIWNAQEQSAQRLDRYADRIDLANLSTAERARIRPIPC